MFSLAHKVYVIAGSNELSPFTDIPGERCRYYYLKTKLKTNYRFTVKRRKLNK